MRRLKKKKDKYFYLLLLIVLMSLIEIYYYGVKYTNKVSFIVSEIVNKNIYDYVFNVFSKDVLVDKEFNNIIYFDKNSNGEIIAINYNFPLCYELLGDSIGLLYDDVNNIGIDNKYFVQKDKVFFIPLGVVSNNIFLNFLGPKIPCRVDLLANANMGFRTIVKNYGINSLLVEIYLVIDITNKILVPYIEEDNGKSYELIVSSKIVNGNIPDYYGGVIEKSSSIITS